MRAHARISRPLDMLGMAEAVLSSPRVSLEVEHETYQDFEY